MRTKALLMLNSLPKSYKGLVVTLMYDKTSITSRYKLRCYLMIKDKRKLPRKVLLLVLVMVRNNHGGKSAKKEEEKLQYFN
jgi:hypothetical protein